MKRLGIFAAVLLMGAIPLQAAAATLLSNRTLVVSEAPPGNAYLTGTDITVTVPLPADVAAFGGTLTLSAPVMGDALLVGGTVLASKAVAGDLRAAGAQITVTGPVTGDLMLAGGSVVASTSASDVHIIGGNVQLTGSGGPVTIYGADVILSGEFDGDVAIVASDSVTLGEGTVIHGALKYDAPQQAGIPVSAVIDNGVNYTGAATYLPTVEQAETFAIAGAGVLYVVKIIALLIAAGLLAGLFPLFTQTVADRAIARTPGRFILLALLGFAIVIATPVLIFLLLISFVGMAVAFMLAASYALLLLLGYVYAGIIAGSALSRGVLKRTDVSWKIALLGMLVLSVIGAIPVFGALVIFILFLAATGAIVSIGYTFAFGKQDVDDLADLSVE
ncbi:MAG: hypothetical protein AB199_01850 [Parcubacteria bacterium C7867-004]|nr:MAG: hypothetical protein AB199_01850 [Parcubacteria bacterium C7867-004]